MRSRATVAVALAALLGAALPSAVTAHGPVPPDPPTVLGILATWSFEPSVLLPLVGALVAWWWMVRRIGRLHPATPVAPSRTLAFVGGVVAVAFALLSGIETYDTTLFSIHMVQHMLLILVAAPLFALAAPITQLLRAAPAADRTGWILPILHSRVVVFLGHPVVASIVFTGVMWASHFSPLFDAALEDRFVHLVEHGLFLVSATLFWWPAVGLDPAPFRMRHPARIMYVFLQMPMSSFLAMAVLFADAPLYHHYATLGSPYGIDPLDDQRLAAGIMWFTSDLVFIAALLVLLRGWMHRVEADTAAIERREDLERAAITERADRLADRRREQGEV